jgi:hypothetical protein
VEKKAFAYRTDESNCKILMYRRKISHICAVFIAYCGERAGKGIGERLERHYYRSRVDHERKIRNRRGRMDIGKYYFVNKTIRLWKMLPVECSRTVLCKPNIFRMRVINAVN